MRHERFAVVLADVTLRIEAGLASEITGELAAVSVLNHNDILLPEDAADLSGVEWNNPFYLKMIGHDSFFSGELFYRFADHAVGRTPPDQCNSSVFGSEKFWRGDVVDRALHFTGAFFHHHPALVRVGKFIADERAVFVVLVRGSNVN